MPNDPTPPLHGAVRARKSLLADLDNRSGYETDGLDDVTMSEWASDWDAIIARESGLDDMSAAVKNAKTSLHTIPGSGLLNHVCMDPQDWKAIQTALHDITEKQE